MIKRIVSGFMALILSLSLSGITVFANEDSKIETIDSILNDEDYLSSDNYMVLELLMEFCEEESVDFITLNWGGKKKDSDHGKIAGSVWKSIKESIPENEQSKAKRCLIFACYSADEPELHDSSADPQVVQLHAIRNYLANLKALWYYSSYIEKYTDSYCYDKVYNMMSNLNDQERKDVKTLLKTIPKIYNLYKKKYHKPSGVEKKYLVNGLALHLIGDIYAHRTLVPSAIAKPSIFSSYFKYDHFHNDSESKYQDLYNAVKSGNLVCTRIEDYMIANLPKSKNTYYEDNPNFLPNRYKYSIDVSKEYFKKRFGSNDPFSASIIKQSSSDGITLYNYKNYKKRI